MANRHRTSQWTRGKNSYFSNNSKTPKIVVAETFEQEIIAFISWVQTYDLHWCLRGGEVIDMFVSPFFRSRGLAILLLTNIAKEIQDDKGAFLKGAAVDNPILHRLYQRIAIRVSENDYYLSGRHFVASLNCQVKMCEKLYAIYSS